MLKTSPAEGPGFKDSICAGFFKKLPALFTQQGMKIKVVRKRNVPLKYISTSTSWF